MPSHLFTSLPLRYVSSPSKEAQWKGNASGADGGETRRVPVLLLRVGIRTAEAPGVEHMIPPTAQFATRVIVEHGHGQPSHDIAVPYALDCCCRRVILVGPEEPFRVFACHDLCRMEYAGIGYAVFVDDLGALAHLKNKRSSILVFLCVFLHVFPLPSQKKTQRNLIEEIE